MEIHKYKYLRICDHYFCCGTTFLRAGPCCVCIHLGLFCADSESFQRRDWIYCSFNKTEQIRNTSSPPSVRWAVAPSGIQQKSKWQNCHYYTGATHFYVQLQFTTPPVWQPLSLTLFWTGMRGLALCYSWTKRLGKMFSKGLNSCPSQAQHDQWATWKHIFPH